MTTDKAGRAGNQAEKIHWFQPGEITEWEQTSHDIDVEVAELHKTLAVDDMPAEIFESAVMAIPNGDDVNRQAWLDVLFSIHDKFRGSEEGRALLQEWSAKWTGIGRDGGSNNPAYNDATWDKVPSNRKGKKITGRTAIALAHKAGWVDPREMTGECLFPDDLPEAEIISYAEWKAKRDGVAAKSEAKLDTSSWAPVWGRPKYGTTPETQWLMGTTYARKFVTGIIAPGGRGKSALMMVQALAAATGKPLLKDEPPRQGPINAWLVNLEEDQVELDRRLEAICIHYEITNEQIGDRLRVNGSDMSLIIATEKKGDFTIHTPIVDAVMKTIRDNETDIMYVDPFVSSHAVSENDNTKIDAVAKTWRRIAVDCDCGIGIAHHIRKPKNGQGDVGFGVDDMRGASALPDALRRVFALNAMTPVEAANFGIEEGERFRYFHVDGAKQNYVRPSSVRIWRKLESVHLGNAVKFGGDWRQVATAWEPPAVDDMTPEEAEKIIEKIKVGEWREDAQADNWVGAALAEVLEWDRKDPDAKKSIKAILKKWIKGNILKVVTRKDANRKERKFVVVNIINGTDEIFPEDDENE